MRSTPYNSPIRHCGLLLCSLTAVIVGVAAEAWATGNTFITIDVPGSTYTSAQGINDRGQVVGLYDDSAGIQHGFLDNKGSFTTIDYPNATLTSADAIDAQGRIVGNAIVGSTATTFLLNNGRFTTLSQGTWPTDYRYANDINAKGQIVGYTCCQGSTFQQGYLQDTNGQTTMINFPGPASTTETMANGINDRGQIVGQVRFGTCCAPEHGFFYNHGVFTLLDVPGATMTVPRDINNRGEIVGSWYDAAGNFHGFLDTNVTFTIIDVPGSSSTVVTDINNAGVFVGAYRDASGTTHGFIDPPSEVPEPRSLLLLASGLGVLAASRKRRCTKNISALWRQH